MTVVNRMQLTVRMEEDEPASAAAGPTEAYFCGLDLGQAHDYTALAIIRQARQGPQAQAAYQLLGLRRWPLGTSYPAIIADVRRTLARPPLSDPRTTLVLDYTGAGRPIWDAFTEAGVPATGIAITGGSAVIRASHTEWHVPKRDLVSVVQILLQERRLEWPASLPEARTLAQELAAFRVRISLAGHDSYEAWREKDHDDTVLAVALACWAGENLAPTAWEFW